MAVIQDKPKPSAPTPKYVDFDEFIGFQLKKTRSGIHSNDLLSAVVVLLAALAAYLLLFAVADHWLIPGGLSYFTRVSLLGILALGSAGWFTWKIIIPWMRQINLLYAARQIERAHPELQTSLMTLVDLRERGLEISPAILSALEKRTAHQISQADVDDAIDRRPLMRASYVLLGLVAAICLYTVLSPKKISTSLWRALLPTSSVAAATRTEIRSVTPGDAEVLAHDQLEVTAELGGKIPGEATLLFTTEDRRFVDEPLLLRPAGEELPKFRGRLTGENGRGLLSNVSYRIVAGDASSPVYHVRVKQPPTAVVSQVEYKFPGYMGLPPQTQTDPAIEAWEGTQVTVRAAGNMPLKSARLYCTDLDVPQPTAEEYIMLRRGDVWEATWKLRFRDDGKSFAKHYFIAVENEEGQRDPRPTMSRINIRHDEAPEVLLLHPKENMEAPANVTLPVSLQARDPDFLLRKVSLKLEHNSEPLSFSPTLFEGPPDRKEFAGTHRLNLGQLALKPGDQLALFAEAEDNFEPFGGRGKNISRSQKVVITIAAPRTADQQNQFQQQQEQLNQQRMEDAQPQPQQPRDGAQAPRRDPQQGAPGEQNPPQPQPEQQPGQAPPNDPANNPPQRNGAAGERGRGGAGGGQQGNPNAPANGNRGDQIPPGRDGNQGNSQPAGNNSSQQGNRGAGQRDGARGNSPGNQPQPGAPPRSNKAQDDEAVEKLLKWDKDQQQQAPESQRAPENSGDAGPEQQGNRGEQPQRDGNPNGGRDGSQNAGSRGQPEPGSNGERGARGDQAAPNSGGAQNRGSGSAGNRGPVPNQSDPRGNPDSASPPGNSAAQDSPPGASGNDPNNPQSGNSNPLNPNNGAQGNPQENRNSPGQAPAPGNEAGNPPQNSGAGAENSPGRGSRDGRGGQGGAAGSPENPPQPNSQGRGEQGRGPNEESQNGNPPANNGRGPDAASPPGDMAPGSPQNRGANTENQNPGTGNQNPANPGQADSKPPGTDSQPGNRGQQRGPGQNQDSVNPNNPAQNPAGQNQSGRNGAPDGRGPNDNPPVPGEGGNPPSGAQNRGPQPNPDAGQQPNAGNSPAGENTPPGDPNAGSPAQDAVQPGQDAGQMPSGRGPNDQPPAGERGGERGGQQGGERGGQPGGERGGQPSGERGGQRDGQSGGEQGVQPSGERGGQRGGERGGQPGGERGGQPGGDRGGQPGGERGGQQPGGEQNAQPGGERGGQRGGERGGQPNGERGSQPGGERGGQPGGERGGQPGGERGGQRGGQEGGGQESGGQEGGGQEGGGEAGQQGGQPRGNPGGQQSGQGPGQPGEGQGGQQPGMGPGPQGNGIPGSGGPPTGPRGPAGDAGPAQPIVPQDADLENRKKAADLALKRLQDQLRRGETPQQLKEELGFTDQDLERFMQRLHERLSDPGLDRTPEAESARRQFDAILKGIEYKSGGQLRDGGSQERSASDSLGSDSRPVPPALRLGNERYRQLLNERGGRGR